MGHASPTNTPYRDEKTSLAWRLERLHEELDGIRRARSELETLTNREDVLLGEISRLTEELAKARAKRTLPLLEMAYVASPCKADWNEMVGDERTRFCEFCKKNVYNVSAMSSDEAETFFLELTGEACVRFYRRKDGTVMTNDCPVGVRNKRIKRAVGAFVGTGIAAAGIAALQAQTGELAIPASSNAEMAVALGVTAIEDQPWEAAPTGTVALPPAPPPKTNSKSPSIDDSDRVELVGAMPPMQDLQEKNKQKQRLATRNPKRNAR